MRPLTRGGDESAPDATAAPIRPRRALRAPARSSCNKVSGTPSSTLITQSRHPGPRAAQSSQSITTGAPGPGATTPLLSGPLLWAIGIGPLVRLGGAAATLTAGTDISCRARFGVGTPRVSVRVLNVTPMGVTGGTQLSFADLESSAETLLRETTFVVVDLETTGGRTRSSDGTPADTITEIGAVKVRGGVVLGEFGTLVDPQRSIPPQIVHAHRHHDGDGVRRPDHRRGAADVPGVRRRRGSGRPQRGVRHRVSAGRRAALRNPSGPNRRCCARSGWRGGC